MGPLRGNFLGTKIKGSVLKKGDINTSFFPQDG